MLAKVPYWESPWNVTSIDRANDVVTIIHNKTGETRSVPVPNACVFEINDCVDPMKESKEAN